MCSWNSPFFLISAEKLQGSPSQRFVLEVFLFCGFVCLKVTAMILFSISLRNLWINNVLNTSIWVLINILKHLKTNVRQGKSINWNLLKRRKVMAKLTGYNFGLFEWQFECVFSKWRSILLQSMPFLNRELVGFGYRWILPWEFFCGKRNYFLFQTAWQRLCSGQSGCRNSRNIKTNYLIQK